MKLLRDIRFFLVFMFLSPKMRESQRNAIIKKVCTHSFPHAGSSAHIKRTDWKDDVILTTSTCCLCGHKEPDSYKYKKIETKKRK